MRNGFFVAINFLFVELPTIFFAAFIVSAWGSVQPGLVNTFIAQSAQDYGKTKAVSLAIIMVIPEFLYASCSVFLSEWMERNPLFQKYAVDFLPFVLLGVGIALVFKKKTIKKEKPSSGMKAKGLLLAMVNVQLPLYWLGMVMAFSHFFGWNFEMLNQKLALILGAGFGAFAMLLVWILVFDFLSRSRFRHFPFSQVFGFILIVTGVVALVKTS